jgi:hypothetical protein
MNEKSNPLSPQKEGLLFSFLKTVVLTGKRKKADHLDRRGVESLMG